jgi:magnesium transporter
MLKGWQCNIHKRNLERITSIDEVQQANEDPNAIVWLDLTNPGDQDLEKIGKIFNLHPLALEDATREHQRPKLEDYEEFYFVVFYSVTMNEKQELNISEVDMFLSKTYLITVHEHAIPELDEVEHRWGRNSKQLEWGIGVLLYSMLDTIVDNYFPIVDALVDQAEELEDRIFEDRTRRGRITYDLLDLKKRFLALRRVATPERDVLNVLTNRDSPIFDEHVTIYFRDVYDHITKLAETIDLYRDQVNTIMDANLSLVSNDLNQVMRTLTVASIILMADSLVAGVYGMNFEIIPELHWHFGYAYALVLMVGISVLLFLIFRRLKWI